MKLRTLASFLLLAVLGALFATIWMVRPVPVMDFTAAPFFELVGRGPGALSRALTRSLPVSEVEEGQYGDAIRESYGRSLDKESKEAVYLNRLMEKLSRRSKKSFRYTVYLVKEDAPNAYAMPGGVIFVTAGLMKRVKDESELMAILAHEMGHVELGHCLATVRFRLVADKIHMTGLGKLADLTVQILTRHSYGKTEEAEADAYAFEFLKESKYDPAGEGRAFLRLMSYERGDTTPGEGGEKELKSGNPILEYFQSHPHLELRQREYTEKAKAWWDSNPGERRYRGARNLLERSPFEGNAYGAEWVEEFEGAGSPESPL
jgi:predicted Zn-dependent protease